MNTSADMEETANVINGTAISTTDVYRTMTSTNHSEGFITLTGFNLWQSSLIGIFLVTIMIISIGGNVLVCVAILTDRYIEIESNLPFLPPLSPPYYTYTLVIQPCVLI